MVGADVRKQTKVGLAQIKIKWNLQKVSLSDPI
jgi:hypothetical protein